jgi:hypothetical protein
MIASLGRSLYLSQDGEVLSVPFSKSMPVVGSDVSELRLKEAKGIYRVLIYG